MSANCEFRYLWLIFSLGFMVRVLNTLNLITIFSSTSNKWGGDKMYWRMDDRDGLVRIRYLKLFITVSNRTTILCYFISRQNAEKLYFKYFLASSDPDNIQKEFCYNAAVVAAGVSQGYRLYGKPFISSTLAVNGFPGAIPCTRDWLAQTYGGGLAASSGWLYSRICDEDIEGVQNLYSMIFRNI